MVTCSGEPLNPWKNYTSTRDNDDIYLTKRKGSVGFTAESSIWHAQNAGRSPSEQGALLALLLLDVAVIRKEVIHGEKSRSWQLTSQRLTYTLVGRK
jgi:hypothetical protein